MTDKAYLLLGPEAGEKQTFLNQLKADLAQKAGEPPEEHRFYPFETSMQDIVSLIRNGSLFSAWKLIIIGQADLLKKADSDVLSEYLKNPSADAVLILLSDETSIKGAWTKSVSKNCTKIFWEMFDSQKKGWLSGFFRNRRISIDPDAAELLLNLVENNTADMKKECEKLALFFGEGARIAKPDIEAYLYHGKEENVFTLFNHIAAADLPGSVDILQKIMLGGDTNTIQLVSGLLWQFRNMQKISEGMKSGENFQASCFKAGVRSKKAQATYSESLKHYSEKDIESMIELTADYDIKLRASRPEIKDLTAQLFLYNIIIKKGRTESGFI